MEEITGEEFVRRLYQESIDEYCDLRVNIQQSIAIDLNNIIERITFKNIFYNGNSIRFYNSDQTQGGTKILKFIECTFISNLTFENCSIYQLKLYSTIFKSEIFTLKYVNLNEFSIRNVNLGTSTFNIKESSIKHLDFEKLLALQGKFNIEDSYFQDFFSITLSTFKNLKINSCKFLKNFDFIGNRSISTPGSECFYNNEFHMVSFFETSFNHTAEFYYSTFSGTCNFAGINNSLTSSVKFLDCSFDKYVQFDKSKLSIISFENIKFNDIVSFQDSIFGTITIDKSIFEKSALFDELQITDIGSCNRKTIRNIKQQLQKAENRIDYNRFRSYELSAYYKELTWNKNFKDKFILCATKWSVGFEHDWRSGAIFTILAGFVTYGILYRIEHVGTYNPNEIPKFFNGFFRFLLVTDFYSPFKEREYIDNAWAWLIFILGKIVIAFGIYEMIQAFRKFKA